MLIRVIPEIYTAYNKLKVNSDDEVALALASVIRVSAVHRVTDTYGPIPYSQIGADNALTSPYDSQEQVYDRLFAELDAALEVLRAHSAESIKATSDKVYAGNLAKWVRYANSLKLRMAMRLSYVAPEKAEAKVREALSEEAGGVITSNADNAQIPTQNNPFRVVMYDYNGGDSRISADITSYMNGYKDPRRAKYFTMSTFTGGIQNGYIGLRSGISIPTQSLLYSNMVVDYTTPLVWMNAAEVAFLKAEAARRPTRGRSTRRACASRSSSGVCRVTARPTLPTLRRCPPPTSTRWARRATRARRVPSPSSGTSAATSRPTSSRLSPRSGWPSSPRASRRGASSAVRAIRA